MGEFFIRTNQTTQVCLLRVIYYHVYTQQAGIGLLEKLLTEYAQEIYEVATVQGAAAQELRRNNEKGEYYYFDYQCCFLYQDR